MASSSSFAINEDFKLSFSNIRGILSNKEHVLKSLNSEKLAFFQTSDISDLIHYKIHSSIPNSMLSELIVNQGLTHLVKKLTHHAANSPGLMTL